MKFTLLSATMALFLAGCSSYAGTYHATARLAPGEEGSTEPGYSLADIQGKLAEEPRILTLDRQGRFIWNTGSAVNEGTWRVQEGQMYLRDDVYNGTPIQAALQEDRVWRVDPDRSMVNTGVYGAYGVEVVYTRQ